MNPIVTKAELVNPMLYLVAGAMCLVGVCVAIFSSILNNSIALIPWLFIGIIIIYSNVVQANKFDAALMKLKKAGVIS